MLRLKVRVVRVISFDYGGTPTAREWFGGIVICIIVCADINDCVNTEIVAFARISSLIAIDSLSCLLIDIIAVIVCAAKGPQLYGICFNPRMLLCQVARVSILHAPTIYHGRLPYSFGI